MADSPQLVRRLAFIKLLFDRAQEDADRPKPFSTDSINRLHDVTEMVLALAAEKLGVEIPQTFMGYWDVLDPKLGRPLGYKTSMKRLNKARVNLKHYGIEPSEDEVRVSLSSVRSFLEDELLDLLGVAFADVTMEQFVAPEAARNLLSTAAEKFNAEDEVEAFADLAQAFTVVIDDYKSRKQFSFARSVFDTAEDMTFHTPFFRGVEDDRQQRFEEDLIKSIEALDFNIALVALGVDMRRYARFRIVCPNVYFMMDGKRHVSDRQGLQRDSVDFEFCRDFVIATSIRLAEFDFDVTVTRRPRPIPEAHSENP
jgi:hypothetical protein